MSATPRREPKTINTILPVLKPGEPGDEVVDGIVVEVVLLTGVVEFEGSVVTLVFPVLFEVVVRTVVVYVTGNVTVWAEPVVDFGPNVITVGEGDCVVTFVVGGLVVGGLVVGCLVVGCLVVGGLVVGCLVVGGLVDAPAIGLTVSLEIG